LRFVSIVIHAPSARWLIVVGASSKFMLGLRGVGSSIVEVLADRRRLVVDGWVPRS
jgi:hypothetical protein